jgi:hypothetical protein
MKEILLYATSPYHVISGVCAIRTLNNSRPYEVTLLLHNMSVSDQVLNEIKGIVESLFPGNYFKKIILVTREFKNRFLESGNMASAMRDFTYHLGMKEDAVFHEFYFFHDIDQGLIQFVCNSYKRMEIITYGDGYGLVKEKKFLYSLMERAVPRLKEGYMKNKAVKPRRAVLALPRDLTGTYLKGVKLTVIPKQLFRSVFQECVENAASLRQYIARLLEENSHREKYIITTDPHVEAGFISRENAVNMFCSIIRENCEAQSVVFIKPHPVERESMAGRMKQVLGDSYTIVELGREMDRYPMELWRELLFNCKVIMSVSSLRLTLKYLYDINTLQPINDSVIEKWYYRWAWKRLKLMLLLHKETMRQLEQWDGEGILWSGTPGILGQINQSSFPHQVLQRLGSHQRIVICGHGKHTRDLLEAFPAIKERTISISSVEKRGDVAYNIPIIEEDRLHLVDYDVVLISSHAFEKEIYWRLVKKGIPKDKIVTLYSTQQDLREPPKEENIEGENARAVVSREKGKKILAFFGHHKAATMWICAIFHKVAKQLGKKHANYYDNWLFNYQLRRTLLDNQIDMFSYTNADYRHVKAVENDILGFHVVRDPRDICVSAYYSHLYSHPTDHWPELISHREKLKRLPKDEGLLLEMEFSRWIFDHMKQWNYFLPSILEIKMEELIKAPYKQFYKIFAFMQLIDEEGNQQDRISPGMLQEVVDSNRFSRKTDGRKQGIEDVKNHYRKGIPGDWVNHFKPEHIAFFKSNYNHLLISLGYEEKENWDSNY